jgi:hypothetical protein
MKIAISRQETKSNGKGQSGIQRLKRVHTIEVNSKETFMEVWGLGQPSWGGYNEQ